MPEAQKQRHGGIQTYRIGLALLVGGECGRMLLIMSHPEIIQGGMGVAVSNWRLARAVAQLGQLGVVSGSLLAAVLVRRLQDGDPDASMRQALEHFPVSGVSARILEEYFVPGGIPKNRPYKLAAMPTLVPNRALEEVTVAANFVEVFLAKRGHQGKVGINLLEKIQLATLPSLYGAMLAGVDYVLMGAGIPRTIPGVLDGLARGDGMTLRVDVSGAISQKSYFASFDPEEFLKKSPPPLKRPHFLAIVSSATLATSLLRKSNGEIDGFVVESSSAGGHNAPPRGAAQLSERGEPVYGIRDVPDLETIRALGKPFWLAGSFGRPGKLNDARRLGARGIQVGTAFAFCEESGLSAGVKQSALEKILEGKAIVFTDPLASATGFPFKVLQLDGTLSDKTAYEKRPRICDLGYLREPWERKDGSIGYRCAGEPIDDFLSKGGLLAQTVGRKCLCNGLLGTIGLGQRRQGGLIELPLVTAGGDVAHCADLLQAGAKSYSAADVMQSLLREDQRGESKRANRETRV